MYVCTSSKPIESSRIRNLDRLEYLHHPLKCKKNKHDGSIVSSNNNYLSDESNLKITKL